MTQDKMREEFEKWSELNGSVDSIQQACEWEAWQAAHASRDPEVEELKAHNAMLVNSLNRIIQECNIPYEFLRKQATEALEKKQEPPSSSYIQTVPDKCDRIIWRGRYWMLPISNKSQPIEDDCLVALEKTK